MLSYIIPMQRSRICMKTTFFPSHTTMADQLEKYISLTIYTTVCIWKRDWGRRSPAEARVSFNHSTTQVLTSSFSTCSIFTFHSKTQSWCFKTLESTEAISVSEWGETPKWGQKLKEEDVFSILTSLNVLSLSWGWFRKVQHSAREAISPLHLTCLPEVLPVNRQIHPLSSCNIVPITLCTGTSVLCMCHRAVSELCLAIWAETQQQQHNNNNNRYLLLLPLTADTPHFMLFALSGLAAMWSQ